MSIVDYNGVGKKPPPQTPSKKQCILLPRLYMKRHLENKAKVDCNRILRQTSFTHYTYSTRCTLYGLAGWSIKRYVCSVRKTCDLLAGETYSSRCTGLTSATACIVLSFMTKSTAKITINKEGQLLFHCKRQTKKSCLGQPS